MYACVDWQVSVGEDVDDSLWSTMARVKSKRHTSDDVAVKKRRHRQTDDGLESSNVRRTEHDKRTRHRTSKSISM